MKVVADETGSRAMTPKYTLSGLGTAMIEAFSERAETKSGSGEGRKTAEVFGPDHRERSSVAAAKRPPGEPS